MAEENNTDTTESEIRSQQKEEETREELSGVDFAPGKSRETSQHSDSASEEESEQQDGVEPDLKADSSQTEIEKLKKEVQELKDSWTRERAEFMNYKKRVQQDQAKYRGDIIADFARMLFPLIDNLERVTRVDTEHEELKNFLTGVEMIRNEFKSVLEKVNIRQESPQDRPFDPSQMEAISMEERDDLETDTVIEVFQQAYTMGSGDDRKVLRPAMVKVGKAVIKTAEKQGSQE